MVQSRSHSDDAVGERIAQRVAALGSTTPRQLAELSDVSATLAREQLQLAESQGRLCRDDTMQGLRFYLCADMSSPTPPGWWSCGATAAPDGDGADAGAPTAADEAAAAAQKAEEEAELLAWMD